MSSNDLPGMWDESDLSGGLADIEDLYHPYSAVIANEVREQETYHKALVDGFVDGCIIDQPIRTGEHSLRIFEN